MKKKKTEKGRFCFEVAVEKKMKKNENRESSVSLFLSPKRPKTNSLLLSTRGVGSRRERKMLLQINSLSKTNPLSSLTFIF